MEERDQEPEEAASTDDSRGNPEAAKYRRRLREVESERDQLAQQVQGFRRAEVERRASDSLQDPSDIWRAGVELNDLMNEDGGELDEDKLSETVKRVADEHPSWAKRPEVSGVDQDQGKTTEGPIGASWAGLLRSGNRER